MWASRTMRASAVLLLVAAHASRAADPPAPRPALDPASIPQFVARLPTFTGARVGGTRLTVRMIERRQKILPDELYGRLGSPFDQGTQVWSYEVAGAGANTPAVTIEAHRGIPTTITYVNALGAGALAALELPVDQTLTWADPLGLGCAHTASPDAACADPYRGPPPAAVHLHGGETPPAFDGEPDAWFTPDGRHGRGYATLEAGPANAATYRYPNAQEATTLWFHDHALGTTRTDVFAGLAGFYLLRDDLDTGEADNALRLPAGDHELEVAIQDRSFDDRGQLLYPATPVNPGLHPLWGPEAFGDTIVVNGRTWPYLEVEPRRYRLRLLDGSNARFYRLGLVDRDGNAGPSFWQIGSDGGLLPAPVEVRPGELLLAPGERADVIVDFSRVPQGTVLTLVNDAPAPFPGGDAPDPATTGRILQVRVARARSGDDRTCDPAASGATRCRLRPAGRELVRLADGRGALASGVRVDERRQLVLVEIQGEGGPLEVLLNNTHFDGIRESTAASGSPQPVAGTTDVAGNGVSEQPRVGSTETWELVNLTGDAHPIHLHLVQLQILNRQELDSERYLADWSKQFAGGALAPGEGPPRPYGERNADGALGGNLPVRDYLKGEAEPPSPGEAGWKDTVVAPPGRVTRLVVRWAPQDVAAGAVSAGQNRYPFDPTLTDPAARDAAGNPGGPGYAWHCHILEHEDNEMMRPYALRR